MGFNSAFLWTTVLFNKKNEKGNKNTNPPPLAAHTKFDLPSSYTKPVVLLSVSTTRKQNSPCHAYSYGL